MATEYKLSYTASEIDDRLGMAGNAVLFTEQELTEEQKAQVRANIGAISQEEKDSITTDIEYAYDGDKESMSDAVWVKNGLGYDLYFKVADLPTGELNIVGSQVSLIVRDNSYQNAFFEITEETLNETVTHGEVVVSAKVSGFTQIFTQIPGESNPITILIICERPGRYKTSLNGWYEDCLFEEKGIYFLEQQPEFGEKYTSNFYTSFTVLNDGSDLIPIEYTGNEVQVFRRGLCIGDSITHGSFNYTGGSAGGLVIRNYSYPAIFNRLTGIEVVNSGIGGATSKTWYEASLDGDTSSGRWFNGEWEWITNPEPQEGITITQALDYSGFDFSIIHMGINDIGMRGEVTVEEAVATYETYMGNIITKLKEENEGIKIFIATIIPCYATPGDYAFEVLNEKIREIVEKTDNAYLIDLNLYSECKSGTAYENQHLTAIGYHKMASELSAYISYIIKTNLDEFKEIQFIGTEYTISSTTETE